MYGLLRLLSLLRYVGNYFVALLVGFLCGYLLASGGFKLPVLVQDFFS